MLSAGRRTLLFAVLGLALLTNPVWLFPHAGDTEYTYERSAVTVENGTLTYDVGDRDRTSLDAVGCQFFDDPNLRLCGLESDLAAEGPVQVSRGDPASVATPEFIELRGEYYQRVQTGNSSTTTYDVERVQPETVLGTIGTDISGVQESDLQDGASVERRAAVTGQATAVTELSEAELGDVYRRDGTAYTVVLTDTAAGSSLVRPARIVFLVAGLILVLATLVEMGRHLEWTER